MDRVSGGLAVDVAAEEGISPVTLYHGRQQARRGGGLFPDVGADPEG